MGISNNIASLKADCNNKNDQVEQKKQQRSADIPFIFKKYSVHQKFEQEKIHFRKTEKRFFLEKYRGSVKISHKSGEKEKIKIEKRLTMYYIMMFSCGNRSKIPKLFRK